MPATIGISAASATTRSIVPSKRPITRDAKKAVTRFNASHSQRLRAEYQIEAKMSSSSRRPACSSTSASPSSRITSTTSSIVSRPIRWPCGSMTGADTRS